MDASSCTADNRNGTPKGSLESSWYNPFNCTSQFPIDNQSGDDEELLNIEDSTLVLMDDTEDFCICRRCRASSGGSLANGTCKGTSSSGHNNATCVNKTDKNSHVNPTSYSINTHSCDAEECSSLLLESSGDEQEGSMHCHVLSSNSLSVKRAKRQLITSCILCLIFMIAEIVGGYLSNSLAVISDAAHLLTDLAGFLMSLFALWVSQKSPTKRMSFGFYRAEILGAVASVFFIWILTGVLVYSAVDRVRYPEYEINADVMLIVSGCGVAMNIVMGLVLHGWCPCVKSSHNHSHGLGSHNHEHNTGEKSNINVRAALIHVIGDLLQSVGVLVAAYVIKYKPEYKIADPICTFLFSALVLSTTFSIMKDAVYILMEGFPQDLNYASLRAALQNVEGVKMAHSLHVWSLTLDKNALAVHLAVEPGADPDAVLQAAQTLIRKKYAIYNLTIQVEKFDPVEMLSCDVCRGP